MDFQTKIISRNILDVFFWVISGNILIFKLERLANDMSLTWAHPIKTPKHKIKEGTKNPKLQQPC
jgi:hypothetical protein